MKNIKRLTATAAFIVLTAFTFAQAPPPPNNGGGDPSGGGHHIVGGGGAPIGGGVFILLGLSFIYGSRKKYNLSEEITDK